VKNGVTVQVFASGSDCAPADADAMKSANAAKSGRNARKQSTSLTKRVLLRDRITRLDVGRCKMAAWIQKFSPASNQPGREGLRHTHDTAGCRSGAMQSDASGGAASPEWLIRI
jgi:hypothetical protein